HLRTLALSSVFQIVFTALKIALVVFLSFALLGGTPSEPAPAGPWFDHVLSAPFAVSLMYTLYAYSGWNAATYVLGEVRAPARVIPAALAAGTVLVAVLYLALNHAFLRAAPAQILEGELNVAQIAAGAVFGEPGGKLVAAIISAGLVSALSAMVWAGPRVAMVLAEDHPRFFGIFRHRNADGIPVNAVIAQSALTLLLLLTATFEQVLVYTQLALLACGFLVVLGLMILRHREPALPRPFRVPLYPLTPLLFLAISAFALVYTAVSRPIEAVCGAVTMLVCLLLYFPARSRRDPAQ
ncbi:MAG: APC family permease, partial [Chthoniobacterales bacterium]